MERIIEKSRFRVPKKQIAFSLLKCSETINVWEVEKGKLIRSFKAALSGRKSKKYGTKNVFRTYNWNLGV